MDCLRNLIPNVPWSQVTYSNPKDLEKKAATVLGYSMLKSQNVCEVQKLYASYITRAVPDCVLDAESGYDRRNQWLNLTDFEFDGDWSPLKVLIAHIKCVGSVDILQEKIMKIVPNLKNKPNYFIITSGSDTILEIPNYRLDTMIFDTENLKWPEQPSHTFRYKLIF